MITKNYIKMCEQAEEIQKLCKHQKGDWFYNGEKPVLYCKAGLGSFDPYEHIWLPTQEQLQEMILKDIDDLEVSFTNKDIPAIEANIWLKKDGKWDSFEPLFADNWNTLWLQIYMLMKYSKIWTDSKWEVTNE